MKLRADFVAKGLEFDLRDTEGDFDAPRVDDIFRSRKDVLRGFRAKATAESSARGLTLVSNISLTGRGERTLTAEASGPRVWARWVSLASVNSVWSLPSAASSRADCFYPDRHGPLMRLIMVVTGAHEGNIALVLTVEG